MRHSILTPPWRNVDGPSTIRKIDNTTPYRNFECWHKSLIRAGIRSLDPLCHNSCAILFFRHKRHTSTFVLQCQCFSFPKVFLFRFEGQDFFGQQTKNTDGWNFSKKNQRLQQLCLKQNLSFFLFSSQTWPRFFSHPGSFSPQYSTIVFFLPTTTFFLPLKWRDEAHNNCQSWITVKGWPILTKPLSILRSWWTRSESPCPVILVQRLLHSSLLIRKLKGHGFESLQALSFFTSSFLSYTSSQRGASSIRSP